MKKLFKAAIAVAMALCLACTVFAASPTATVDVGTAVGPSGEPVTVTESAPTETPTAAEAVEVLKDVAPEGTEAEDLSVVYSMDLSVPAEDLPVTITFTVNGAKADDDIYVLHFDGSAWEVVASGKGDTITATFTSLSPVAVVLQAAEDETPSVGDRDLLITSPQTGADMTVLYAGVAVFVAAGAAALAARKKNA